jgi:hypothetical protein
LVKKLSNQYLNVFSDVYKFAAENRVIDNFKE